MGPKAKSGRSQMVESPVPVPKTPRSEYDRSVVSPDSASPQAVQRRTEGRDSPATLPAASAGSQTPPPHMLCPDEDDATTPTVAATTTTVAATTTTVAATTPTVATTTVAVSAEVVFRVTAPVVTPTATQESREIETGVIIRVLLPAASAGLNPWCLLADGAFTYVKFPAGVDVTQGDYVCTVSQRRTHIVVCSEAVLSPTPLFAALKAITSFYEAGLALRHKDAPRYIWC
jgi:hypothetical protein